MFDWEAEVGVVVILSFMVSRDDMLLLDGLVDWVMYGCEIMGGMCCVLESRARGLYLAFVISGG
jgi:hypothetical protein